MFMNWKKPEAIIDACTLYHTAIFKQCIALYAQPQAITKCDTGTADGNMMIAVQSLKRKLCSKAAAPGDVTFFCDRAHLQ